jgi:peptidoglycan/xylan/chitin deacetylase (PgdA/CDA1 family)
MRLIATIFLASLLTLPAFGQAASTGPDVQIAPFRDDHPAAISYTFDDGLQDQFTIAVPMLEARGMHATFYIIAGKVVDTEAQVAAKRPGDWGTVTWTRLREVAAHGHEIGSHSWSHPNLPKLDDPALAFEIAHADEVLAQQIGKFPLTIAYPGNSADDRVQTFALKTHLADRNGGIYLPQPAPGKATNLGPWMTIIGFGGKDFTVDTADAWADQLVEDGKWGVAVIHGIVVGYSAMGNPQVFADHLDHVKALGDRVWIDTFANVAGYLRMRTVGKINVTGRTGNSVTFTLSADLPPPPAGLTFPVVPLTLRIMQPGAARATASAAGKPLPVVVRPDRILVTACAGPDPITVSW